MFSWVVESHCPVSVGMIGRAQLFRGAVIYSPLHFCQRNSGSCLEHPPIDQFMAGCVVEDKSDRAKAERQRNEFLMKDLDDSGGTSNTDGVLWAQLDFADCSLKRQALQSVHAAKQRQQGNASAQDSAGLGEALTASTTRTRKTASSLPYETVETTSDSFDGVGWSQNTAPPFPETCAHGRFDYLRRHRLSDLVRGYSLPKSRSAAASLVQVHIILSSQAGIEQRPSQEILSWNRSSQHAYWEARWCVGIVLSTVV
eukprot:SAG31_NODE_394_length_16282_cov_132.890564_5_plen_256_part_00